MRAALLAVVALLAAACTDEPDLGERSQPLTEAARRERLALIRDSAAELGVVNAALIGGIAISETQLAHCWSEATYACKGPASSSCGGGPIIAGSADGPCADEQGGLGMFQFDAGTYAETLATYGDDVLTVEGNTAQAVAFVIDKVIRDVDGADDWLGAAAWINQVPLVAGDPVTEAWAALLACRYNGCCAGTATCTRRADDYRDHAIELYAEQGPAFWRTRDRCAAIPAGGIIDQRSACYVAGGEPRYWRREAAGYADSREWTGTTAAGAAGNFAVWAIRPTRAGRYRVEVYAAGGAARMARYEVRHAAGSDAVVVDQAAADGFVTLGEFAFVAAADTNEDQRVLLADNTGASGDKLVFDAVRVTALDGGGEGADDGGCAVGGGGGGGLAAALAALAALVRRRASDRGRILRR